MGSKAAKEAIAQAVAADAGMPFARIDAMLDRGDRRHRFQRRTGGIKPARRLVDQRLMIVGAQPAIFIVADPVRKAVGVKTRHRDER